MLEVEDHRAAASMLQKVGDTAAGESTDVDTANRLLIVKGPRAQS
ncbi:MAG: hypothetical protein WBQ69_04520 [Gallionella sp.]